MYGGERGRKEWERKPERSGGEDPMSNGNRAFQVGRGSQSLKIYNTQ